MVGVMVRFSPALYRAQSRFGEAEPLYRGRLTIYEKALGPNHPEVAAALGNLASLYRDQGRYAKASRSSGVASSLRRRCWARTTPT